VVIDNESEYKNIENIKEQILLYKLDLASTQIKLCKLLSEPKPS